MATVSIPPIFQPVRWDDYELHDAGCIDSVPIDVLFDPDADMVIAVSADLVEKDKLLDGTRPSLSRFFGGISGRLRSLRVDRSDNLLGTTSRVLDVVANCPQKCKVSRPHIMLQPDFRGMSANTFHREEETVALGERVARENLPAIRQLIEENLDLVEG